MVTYDGWWGHDTLPKLNYEDSPKLEAYILRDREEMGVTAVQCGWLAFGCGSGSWTDSNEYNHDILEKVP